MRNYERLDYLDGTFRLVFPPTVTRSKHILAYYLEFKQALEGETAWPPEETDETLFENYRVYYDAIASLFEIQNTDQLKTLSRHTFFIAGEPLELRGNVTLGLNGIEKLLGYEYPKESSVMIDLTEEAPPTTGDIRLDVITAALLTFKVSGLEDKFSLKELSSMVGQAAELQRRAESKDEDEAGDSNLQTEEDHPDFVKFKPKIKDWLESLNIPLPLDF